MAEKKIFLGVDLTKEGYSIASYDFVKNEPGEQVEHNGTFPTQYHSMVVTMEQTDYAGWENTKQFMEQHHISKDNVRVVTHLHAFLAFLTHQELEIWDHNVGLFEYKKEGLFYHQININKSKMPIRAHLATTSYAHVLGPDSMNLEKTDIDQEFVHIVRQVLTKGVISAVYLTGEGFQKDWLNESIDVLCASRRVFMGQDLFAKGACYLAKQDWEATASESIVISGEGFIDYEIGIIADVDEKEEFIPIVSPGREWYLTQGNLDVILKKGTKVDIIYRNQQGQVVEREVLDLTFLPKRPDGTNRIRISIDFTGKNQGGITVKDLGFGRLFPTTNQIYRKEFMLD